MSGGHFVRMACNPHHLSAIKELLDQLVCKNTLLDHTEIVRVFFHFPAQGNLIKVTLK